MSTPLSPVQRVMNDHPTIGAVISEHRFNRGTANAIVAGFVAN